MTQAHPLAEASPEMVHAHATEQARIAQEQLGDRVTAEQWLAGQHGNVAARVAALNAPEIPAQADEATTPTPATAARRRALPQASNRPRVDEANFRGPIDVYAREEAAFIANEPTGEVPADVQEVSFEASFADEEAARRAEMIRGLDRSQVDRGLTRHANRARRAFQANALDYAAEERGVAFQYLDEAFARNPVSDEDYAHQVDHVNAYMFGEGAPVPEAPEDNRDRGVPSELVNDPEFGALNDALTAARTKYIELTAARRRSHGVGRKGKNALAEAREAYEAARDAAGAYVAGRLEDAGADADQIKQYSFAGAVEEIHEFESELWTVRTQAADSKRLKGFYNWWARQRGVSGTIKKAFVSAPFGVAAGIVSAVALGPVLPVAAIAGAGAMARGVARNLANGRISKNANASRVATEQANYNIHHRELGLGTVDNMQGTFSTGDLTAAVEAATNNDVKRNRIRTVGSMAVGALAGGVGAVVGAHLIGDHHLLNGNHHGGGAGKGAGGNTANPRITHPTQSQLDRYNDLAKDPATKAKMDNYFAAQNLKAGSVINDVARAGQDVRYPWQHFADKVGAGNATPKIMELVGKGNKLGYKIIGNGQGNGSGAITRIELPGGQMVPGTDFGRINAILDSIDAAK